MLRKTNSQSKGPFVWLPDLIIQIKSQNRGQQICGMNVRNGLLQTPVLRAWKESLWAYLALESFSEDKRE